MFLSVLKDEDIVSLRTVDLTAHRMRIYVQVQLRLQCAILLSVQDSIFTYNSLLCVCVRYKIENR